MSLNAQRRPRIEYTTEQMMAAALSMLDTTGLTMPESLRTPLYQRAKKRPIPRSILQHEPQLPEMLVDEMMRDEQEPHRRRSNPLSP